MRVSNLSKRAFGFFRRLKRATVTRASHAIRRRMTFAYLKWHGVEAEYGSVLLIGFPIIQKAPGSTIRIGKNAVLVSSHFNPAGICHPVVLATLRSGAKIEIGDNNGLSGTTICAAESVKTGSYVKFGANSAVYDTDFHSSDHLSRRTQHGIDSSVPIRPVVVGDDVWIAANAIVLKGTCIGDRSVIGAGAVVTSSIPCDSVAGGVPAKVIKSRSSDNTAACVRT